MPRKSDSTKSEGGFLQGFIDLIETLGDLAEKGESFSKEFEGKTSTNKKFQGVYGFSLKTASQGEGVKVEPFGNLHKDKKSGRTFVQEAREPLVDVFEEDGYTLVVAELPGMGLEDIRIAVDKNILSIEASKGELVFKKEIALPKAFKKENMHISCNNGILNIQCLDKND